MCRSTHILDNRASCSKLKRLLVFGQNKQFTHREMHTQGERERNFLRIDSEFGSKQPIHMLESNVCELRNSQLHCMKDLQ